MLHFYITKLLYVQKITKYKKMEELNVQDNIFWNLWQHFVYGSSQAHFAIVQ